MIIIRLTGGLGNQLFQYAFARSLAKNMNKELFLDISFFSHNEKRKHVVFGLNSFNIKGIIGNYPENESTRIGFNYSSPEKLNIYSQEVPQNFPTDVLDYEEIITLPDVKFPAYFKGYFQKQNYKNKSMYITENFFKNNNAIIHKDLEFKLPLTEYYQRIVDDMKKYDSVAIHVRRGDYVNFPNFGFCTIDYYYKAIHLMATKLSNPKFYIFTEDHEWFERNINIDYPLEHVYYKQSNNSSSRGYGELLYVMSQCKHFIIANSTFSWWGAFLGKNYEKMIITPKPWFSARTFVEVDSIDNKKTINIRNDFKYLFDMQTTSVWNLFDNNLNFNNLKSEIKDNYLILKEVNKKSELILSKLKFNDKIDKIIVHLNLESKEFDGLKIYFKTSNDDFSEKKSKSLFFYKTEEVNYYGILPSEVTEIMIKPSILNENNELIIKNIEIREIHNTEYDFSKLEKKG